MVCCRQTRLCFPTLIIPYGSDLCVLKSNYHKNISGDDNESLSILNLGRGLDPYGFFTMFTHSNTCSIWLKFLVIDSSIWLRSKCNFPAVLEDVLVVTPKQHLTCLCFFGSFLELQDCLFLSRKLGTYRTWSNLICAASLNLKLDRGQFGPNLCRPANLLWVLGKGLANYWKIQD